MQDLYGGAVHVSRDDAASDDVQVSIIPPAVTLKNCSFKDNTVKVLSMRILCMHAHMGEVTLPRIQI